MSILLPLIEICGILSVLFFLPAPPKPEINARFFSMPIYEYQCTLCGRELEAFQKITDAPLTECPNCHKDALKKLVSATSFQLKGTGWYATDFRDKGKPKPTTTENGDSTSSGGGKESQTETSASKETKTNETKGKDSKSKDSKSKASTSNNSSAE